MKFVKIIFLLMSSVLFASCSTDEEGNKSLPQAAPAKFPISWNVLPITDTATNAKTRTLIDDNLLENACTPNAGNTNESIGLWGQYSMVNSTQNETYVEFDATPLTFAPKTEDTNPYNSWNYPGEARYWENSAVYDFRACYPQALMTSLMTQMDATMFQGGPINTSILQEDILVAAKRVNTITASLSKPVPLVLQHIFAALRFKAKAADGYTPPEGEGITSCWLQNQSNATDLFSPSGYLVHTGNEQPEIVWYTYESSDVPMYLWKHNGVSFNTESLLYVANSGLDGNEYTANDGWILVVPQQVKPETLSLCYTMKNTGDMVFTKKIPAITYEYGKQYTYVLEISGSEAKLTLKIADWNRLDSSHDIII